MWDRPYLRPGARAGRTRCCAATCSVIGRCRTKQSESEVGVGHALQESEEFRLAAHTPGQHRVPLWRVRAMPSKWRPWRSLISASTINWYSRPATHRAWHARLAADARRRSITRVIPIDQQGGAQCARATEAVRESTISREQP